MDFAEGRTLYHEAGHAVISLRRGIRVRSMTVVPSGEYLGCVVHPPSPDWFRPDLKHSARVMDKIDGHARALLAGMRAETRWAESLDRLPRRWRSYIRAGAQSDLATATDLALYRAAPDAASAYLTWIQAEVDAALRAPQVWKEIEAVVEALRRKPSLTSREVRDAIESVSPVKVLPR